MSWDAFNGFMGEHGSDITQGSRAFAGLAGGITSFVAGQNAKTKSRYVAETYDRTAREEGRLAEIYSTRLLGMQTGSFAAAGMATDRGTAADIKLETAWFERHNRARAIYKPKLQAEVIRRRGDASSTAHILQGMGQMSSLTEAAKLASDRYLAEDITTTPDQPLKTILGPTGPMQLFDMDFQFGGEGGSTS